MNRYEWLLQQVGDAPRILVVGLEDKALWEQPPLQPRVTLTADLPDMVTSYPVTVCAERLQVVEQPIAFLQRLQLFATKTVLTVPFEQGWEPRWKPFENKQHRRHYDAETLAQDLGAVFAQYQVIYIADEGWTWLGAICYPSAKAAGMPTTSASDAPSPSTP